MKKRIWELDALRGLCVLGMVVIHLIYDMVDLYGLVQWEAPAIYDFLKRWGGILFLLISGICVTLGSRPVRRGLTVLAGGLICTAVTVGMYLLGFSQRIIIYFGVLHCLGVCMLCWPAVKKWPVWLLAAAGVVVIAAGLLVEDMQVQTMWLLPLGLTPQDFATSDYFPLLPNLGFFLLGAVLGKTLYREKQSLLPNVDPKNPIVAFLLACGKHSLWIYLLHQPVLSGICYLISLAK